MMKCNSLISGEFKIELIPEDEELNDEWLLDFEPRFILRIMMNRFSGKRDETFMT
jgi:hypothetical protein